ncbi:MAG: inorganic phosphate transporter [Clostridia bacterium]|nr:inorganic phosphate transporter [Clostridia bacterium]
MELTFQNYIINISQNFPLAIISLLILGVVLVNGWTDAPNAIATCVSTRTIRPKNAIIMAAIFNFLGVLVMTIISSTVAETLHSIADFGDNASNALIALCAGMISIVLWAIMAWLFGIPTSESHALIAGVSGAAIAIQKGISGINIEEWKKVIVGLVLSAILGFILGYIVTKAIEKICCNLDRRKTIPFFKKMQIFSGGAMAFMHGAQDGQKFIGIFLLAIELSNGITNSQAISIPFWLMILCSLTMTLGTSIGGYKIIKTVGMKMVKLETYQGASADLASSICLFVSTLFGIPVSTTQVKTTAIMGVGASKRISNVNWKVVKNMFLAWIITFPACGLLGYVTTFIFMKIFV